MYSQVKSHTLANGRSASGDSPGLTNWLVITASIQAQSRLNVQCASVPSRAPTTSRSTWSAICPKPLNDTREEAGIRHPRLRHLKYVILYISHHILTYNKKYNVCISYDIKKMSMRKRNIVIFIFLITSRRSVPRTSF